MGSGYKHRVFQVFLQWKNLKEASYRKIDLGRNRTLSVSGTAGLYQGAMEFGFLTDAKVWL